MFCRNCGKEVAEEAAFCVSCGVPPRNPGNFCWNCGAEAGAQAEVCTQCGVRLGAPAPAAAQAPAQAAAGGVAPQPKSKLIAGLLGILVGGLGVHRFYLGYNKIGAIQLALFLILGIPTCGIGCLVAGIWGLVEGILILTGSTITTDAQGYPLQDQ